MRYRCAMCGRITTPYVMIGAEAIGPTCARKQGWTPAKAPKGSKLRFTNIKPVRETGPRNLDLFDDHDPQPDPA